MTDPCKPIQDRITALNVEKRLLQEDLQSAPPSQKPGIIRAIRETEIKITEQREELRRCRAQNPPPVRPDILLSLSSCLTPEIRGLVENALTGAFADGVAHSRCINGIEMIGIWLPSRGEVETRLAGLGFVNILPQPDENFTIQISGQLIRRMARAAFEQQPRAIDDNLQENPNGPICLTNFSFRPESPDRMVTLIEGFRRFDHFPDVDFTLTVTDTFTLENDDNIIDGGIHCKSSTQIDADFPFQEAFLNLILGGPLGIARALFSVAAEFFISSFAPDDIGGVGCGILQIIPQQIVLDGNTGLSLIPQYRRIVVDDNFPGSLRAGGTVVLAQRAETGFSVSANLTNALAS